MSQDHDFPSRPARRQVKAVVFDFWRTLAYSCNREPIATLQALLEFATSGHHGDTPLHPLFLRLCRTIPFRNRRQFLHCVAGMFNYKLTPEAFAQFDLLCRQEVDNLVRYPDVEVALPELAKDFKLACIINGWPATLDEDLSKIELTRWINPQLIVCSCDVGVEKPNPEIFRHTQALLQVEASEILMIGDQPLDDVQGALSAGWHARHIIRTGEQRAVVPGVKIIGSLLELLADPLLYNQD